MTALAYVLIVVAMGELTAAVERHSRVPMASSRSSFRTSSATRRLAHN